MIRLTRRLMALLCLSVSPAAYATETLSMQDLEALMDQGQWVELAERAIAVPPAERTDRWQALVTKAATNGLRTPALAHDAALTVGWSDHLLLIYPHLAREQAFMGLRADNGFASFETCFSNPSRAKPCNESLRRFVAQDPANHALMLKAASLVSKRFSTKHVAMPYFYWALKDRSDKDACTSGNFRKSAISALALKAPAAEIAQAEALVFGPCWPFVDARFIKEITNTDAHLTNTCAQLLTRQALAGPRLAKCQRLAR